ncbi:TatD family hydrolase [Sporosarcina cascadiensis]|uniref:TatD family hydrolase n=1 Tax=Sporosarcina cascadiensis TaxID=2660747 RepID=UPI00129ADCAF|nr:TatD family hydrolase [Sporosarcina cascadiensis]
MNRRLIDAHIHLDMYSDEERILLLKELEASYVDALVAVSKDLSSSHRQLESARFDSRIKAAIGWHPEQAVPSEEELQAILNLIDENHHLLTTVGEVGLPYYLRQKKADLDLLPYVKALEKFIQKAAHTKLPIVLHAVYEDAAAVCDLLEAYSIMSAHFHWFKGEDAVLKRILANGYVVSVTPDVVYKEKIQHIVEQTPLSQLMVETDGPWPFEERFSGKLTHPSMMHESVQKIADIKRMNADEVYKSIYETTKAFYRIE